MIQPEPVDDRPVDPARQHGSVQLAVSTVIFAMRQDGDDEHHSLWLPLVRRLREPYRGMFALPGGPLSPDLSLEKSAGSTLERATGLVPGYLEQLYAFGRVHRTSGPEDEASEAVTPPCERVVSVVYWASIPATEVGHTRVHENIQWMRADALPRLAFDHNEIVDYALYRLKNKVEYSRIAHSFLGEEFTLAELREVYEAILGRRLDPANFRRQIAASKSIIDTGKRIEGTRHRPPRLFRYDHTQAFADQGPLGMYRAAAHDAAVKRGEAT
ncbi:MULTISPECIES: NUDIX hydrolase [Micrococcales]|uniref:NUDIX hydrolase n=1 Tax=Micrococcales TaxID=85006 RepID=UPI0004AB1B66|nr:MULTISPECIES: ADP-ribose pyrophosphatase [Micrococcales]